MILFEEALKIVLNCPENQPVIQVDFLSSLNKVLAEDVISDMDMPPFNKSAVDGYACRKEDINTEMEVLETIQAGALPQMEIQPNTCSKIMTGAMIPANADCVIMVEHTILLENNKIKFNAANTAHNICFLGEDTRKGDVVLKKGTIILPQHIAVMASVGCTKPLVFQPPVIGIISTGNELVEPFEKPEPTKIRNSNAYQLMAQAKNIGVPINYIGIAPDTLEGTQNFINLAFEQSSIILLTGGVSMGDFDFVPMVLKDLGFEIHFHNIAIQPGKPTLFASKNGKYCFGLPGNPVSSFIQFELLVKPLIYKLQGCVFQPIELEITLNQTYSRKKSDRLALVPVNISADKQLKITEFHGSAHINAMIHTSGLMSIPIGITTINAGEKVHVRLF